MKFKLKKDVLWKNFLEGKEFTKRQVDQMFEPVEEKEEFCRCGNNIYKNGSCRWCYEEKPKKIEKLAYPFAFNDVDSGDDWDRWAEQVTDALNSLLENR